MSSPNGNFSEAELDRLRQFDTCTLSNVIERLNYLALDSDANGSGQQAARRLSSDLTQRQVTAVCPELPDGLDPNSFFVSGGDANEFQSLLERASQ